jgi:thiaminase
MKAESLLKDIRSSLAPLNEKILNHPYIIDAEKGILPLAKIKAFASNQYYIISHDAKSLSLMLSRTTNPEELKLFEKLAKGDLEGFHCILKMAETLGFTIQELENLDPVPNAVAYTHYLCALAQFASPGEQAMALIANLSVWGLNCGRLSKALREKYQIKETSFLDLFAGSTKKLVAEALQIIEGYLPEKERSMRRVVKLIQAYELMFWDGLYRG